MKLTFHSQAASPVYVTFAAQSSDMVYAPGTPEQETINFSANNVVIGGVTYGTSKAYDIADIDANGFEINSATSLVGFISYGSTDGIALLPQGQQPAFLDPATPRYSVFELTYDGTNGGADLTNISQFGGSLAIMFVSGEDVGDTVYNSLQTTDLFNCLAEASGFSGSASTPAVFLDGDGRFVRVVGTNVFPNGATQNPYPTFNAYLQSLSGASGGVIVQELTNLAPGQKPGGTGAAGFPSTAAATHVTASTVYNLDYHFQATVALAEQTDSNSPDTYSVTLSGYVNATLAASDAGDVQSYQYDGLSITIAADDLVNQNLYMTNFIYQAATVGAGIDVTLDGWDQLNNDFGVANVTAAVVNKVAGDFAQGMTCGFVGSTTLSTTSPQTPIGELSSYQWWQNPGVAYSHAQPAQPFYSVYGNAVYANSGGRKNGVTFQGGGVYGAVYDDRFNLNLISADSSTTEMRVVVAADGDLKPSTAKQADPVLMPVM